MPRRVHSVDAARALGGPDWLVARRVAAAEQLDGLTWPTPSEEIWRYSRIDELDLDALPAVHRGRARRARRRARAGRRAVGGRSRRARGDARRARRPGRAPRARPRARGQGRARLRHRDVRRRRRCATLLGRVSSATADAFTVAARRVPRRRRVRPRAGRASSSRTRSSCSTGARATGARRSRTRSCSLGENAEATVLDRFGSPTTDHLVDAVTELIVDDNAHLRYLSVQEHGPRTWHLGLQRADLGRDATRARRRRSRSAATTPACAARRARRPGRRERPARGLLRRRHADARLPHAAGPRRAATRAATCCSRARSRTTRARCTRASCACGSPRRRRTRSRPTATSCSPRARARSRSRTSRSRPTT